MKPADRLKTHRSTQQYVKCQTPECKLWHNQKAENGDFYVYCSGCRNGNCPCSGAHK